MDPLVELRTKEKEAGAQSGLGRLWLGNDHIQEMKDRDRTRAPWDDVSFNREDRPLVMRLFRAGGGYPIVEINGRPFQLELRSNMGKRGFQKLLERDDLYDFLLGSEERRGIEVAPKPSQPFSPSRSRGYGYGIVFAESLEARIREAQSQGGTLSKEELAEWIATHPDQMTSYHRVATPFRPEVFFKADEEGHMAGANDMWIVQRRHPITDSKLPDVPEPERVTYVTKNGINVVQTIGIDSTGNGEEMVSVNRLLNVKKYPGCASVNFKLTVVDPTLPHINKVGHPALDFEIGMNIYRDGELKWSGSYRASDTKRSDDELFRETRQTQGKGVGRGSPFFAFMGTGSVPPIDFSVEPGDRVLLYSPELGILDVTVKPVIFDEARRSLH